MAHSKASPAIRAAQSRGVDDAVNGKPFDPPAWTDEGRAYATRYAEYMGEGMLAAYAYLEDPAAWQHRRNAPEAVAATFGFEQLSLFGGVV